ncbi:SCO3374 family protein [Streptomyces sp. OP7]|uniref:SCO3374 family protein n=1 Tax=Streptomyces sp. OP7 TaxID=3142462 RepID=UPI0032E9091B
MVSTRTVTVPPPRAPDGSAQGDRTRFWYENVLGWPTVPGVPPRLVVGPAFDVLDVPAEAGCVALERLGAAGQGFPVALQAGRLRLLVAPGGADELPGLLEWLEWGGVGLDLLAVGEGGFMDAPVPWTPAAGPCGTRSAGTCGRGGDGPQGAAVWLRPPEPGREAGASLPTLSAMGTRGSRGDGAGPPDLVRLVNTVATQIHRVRLRRAGAGAAARAEGQPLAFS